MPEWEMFERNNYTCKKDEDIPALAFSTAIGPNELQPMPAEHTFNY